MAFQRVSVVGLGMMGGSLARALAARGVHVLGYDRLESALTAASAEGIVHETLDPTLVGAVHSDAVLLATPLAATTEWIARLGASTRGTSPRRALIMDIGSTKHTIVAAAEAAGIGQSFVGAHPLTGSHRSGWGASHADLFTGARVFLCPCASTMPAVLRNAQEFWRTLDTTVEVMESCAHDEKMAWCSHMPHVLSAALAIVLREAGIPRSALGPGGRDITRLAGGDPRLWTEIVRDNRVALLEAIAAMESHLSSVRRSLSGEESEIFAAFTGARSWFDEVAECTEEGAAGHRSAAPHRTPAGEPNLATRVSVRTAKRDEQRNE